MELRPVAKKDKQFHLVTDARTCFLGSDAGRRVLAAMMTEAKFFSVIKTSEEQAVENFMKVILGWTGSYPQEGHSAKERIDKFVSNLLTMEIEY